VLALVGESATGQGEDTLEVTADGEQGWCVKREIAAERHEAAGTANELRGAIDDGHNGIVAALQNFAVVHQKCVGNVAQARTRFSVVDGYGFFAEVGQRS
jgi:hypothetical protein